MESLKPYLFGIASIEVLLSILTIIILLKNGIKIKLFDSGFSNLSNLHLLSGTHSKASARIMYSLLFYVQVLLFIEFASIVFLVFSL